MTGIKSMKLYTDVERIQKMQSCSADDNCSAVDHQFQSGKLGGLRLCAIRQG